MINHFGRTVNNKRKFKDLNRRTSTKKFKRMPTKKPVSNQPTIGSVIRAAVSDVLTSIQGGSIFKAIADFGFKVLNWKTKSKDGVSDIEVPIGLITVMKKYQM